MAQLNIAMNCDKTAKIRIQPNQPGSDREQAKLALIATMAMSNFTIGFSCAMKAEMARSRVKRKTSKRFSMLDDNCKQRFGKHKTMRIKIKRL